MRFDFSLQSDVVSSETHVIAVTGEVDIFTAPELRDAILDAIGQGARNIVIDFASARFLDSTGLGVLIGAVRHLQPIGGRLIVANTAEPIAQTFAITGAGELFTLVETRDQALALVATPPD